MPDGVGTIAGTVSPEAVARVSGTTSIEGSLNDSALLEISRTIYLLEWDDSSRIPLMLPQRSKDRDNRFCSDQNFNARITSDSNILNLSAIMVVDKSLHPVLTRRNSRR